MSDDASRGIAYLTIAENKGGALDEVQASGVLVAPDELLTASHVVNADDGGLRTEGTVYPGYDAGASPLGSYAVENVHALSTHAIESVADVGSDLALIHLTFPVTGGTVFAMSADQPSSAVNISGYPAGLSGARSTTTEALSRLAGLNVSRGDAIAGGTDAHGASGGPVWQEVSGVDAAYGTLSSGTSTTDYFSTLTSAEVTQIERWIAADHTGAGNQDGTLMNLAAVIAADAPSHHRLAAAMDDVAAALTQLYGDGYTGSSMSAATMDVVSVLQNTSATPSRSAAYAAGLFVAEQGIGKTDLFSSINGAFSGVLGTKATRAAAATGYDEAVSFLNG